MTRLQRIFTSLVILTGVAMQLVTTSVVHAQPEPLTIAAANSLRDAFRKLLPLFEAQHKEITVKVIYGPSQTLRKQIEEGAPVDVYLPSLFEEIDQLEQKHLVLEGTKRSYAATSLVLITATALPAPVRSVQDLHTVPVRRIAIGDPKTSSVGKVALQFLKHSKLDAQLKSQYVYGQHSRAVLDLVANGEAEVGVVYQTDAVGHSNVRILDTASPDSHNPVRYGVATAWTAKNISGAKDFTEFLLSPEVQEQLKQFGFNQSSSDVSLAQRKEVKP
ncbi:Molybdenum ABC transporter, periplasmic binding protein [Nitrospira sp. KM1]|uniref:molybdate ABC transporter substrate-binding protein n=1 Tax=Nitrospira sp. KM1 TaxID=1936990 RepID=UPI0013A74787|nr:molybdate ABC transporter substrate-binding protein [Nitrospira sp. KM1]BCA53014.1 Molybdenum ABC transporter, periplasmic binding protein [Nitrospira sp. KM1]